MKPNQSIFRFYEELNDLLSGERFKRDSPYHFDGNPTVKDAIEAMGVPHTEVDLILVNGVSVDFACRLRDGDRVSVYPVFESLDIRDLTHLRPEPLRRTRFILDVHLGKLARYLRMLGFDCLYRNDLEDEEIVALSVDEKRIILTRDRGILKQGRVTHGCLIRKELVDDQVREVLKRFDLGGAIRPFSRCTACNASLEPVNKAEIRSELQPRTERYFEEFYRCPFCRKIFWKGSHYDRMTAKIRDEFRKEPIKLD